MVDHPTTMEDETVPAEVTLLNGRQRFRQKAYEIKRGLKFYERFTIYSKRLGKEIALKLMHYKASGRLEVYYNGNLVKEERKENFIRFGNGKSVLRSAFVIGQDQDIMEGGYDVAQLFNGYISELNISPIMACPE